tara:strand:- start:430 stop:564 length:135 start_codon:yes stop_codon:yes gene_type:complete
VKKKTTEKYFSLLASVLNNFELSKTPTTIKHESKKLEIIGCFLS